jgi:hypothetical protein
VARRNFHRRHGHGLSNSRATTAGAAAKTAATIPKSSNKKKPKEERETSEQPTVATANVPSSSANLLPNSDLNNGKSMQMQRIGKSKKRKRPLHGLTGLPFEPVEGTSLSRQIRWCILLGERPDNTNDAEAMASWMAQVMSISDLSKPLGSRGRKKKKRKHKSKRRREPSPSSSSSSQAEHKHRRRRKDKVVKSTDTYTDKAADGWSSISTTDG